MESFLKFRWSIISIFWLIFFLGPSISISSTQITPSQENPKTVFVQLFEWPWKEIAKECEIFLGPQQFAAIQVSPPQEHLMNSRQTWWSRYQVVSYQLESRSGTEAEFIDMVHRCQRAGVDVYVDTVINHMTGVTSGVGSAGTRFTQYDYPNLFNYDDFHFCGRNGNNDILHWTDLYELQFCQLVGLADLKTESPKVQNTQAEYLNHLMDIGVKGLRIDAAKHIPPQDIFSIISKVRKNPYVYLELIIGPEEPIPVQKYLEFADINVFPYAFLLGNAFHQKDISNLNLINQQFPPSEKSIVFLENHDLERMEKYQNQLLLSQVDPRLNFLGTVFMLTWPYGYPQLYSGYEFHDYDSGPESKKVLDNRGECLAPWSCQHRAPGITALVKFRNFTNSYFNYSNWWSNNQDQIAYSRGSFGFVAINLSSHKMIQTLHTDLGDGVYCDILSQDYNENLKTCKTGWKVDSHHIDVELPPLSAMVLQSNLHSKLAKKVSP